MTPEQFAYWLQGFAEIHTKAPTDEEWLIIKDHLQTIFTKVTPDRGNKIQYTPLPNIVQPHNPVTPAIGDWIEKHPFNSPPYPVTCKC